jgi:hypothetical protein
MEEAIADGVGQIRTADDAVAVLGRTLAGSEGRGALGAVFDDLDQVAALAVA